MHPVDEVNQNAHAMETICFDALELSHRLRILEERMAKYSHGSVEGDQITIKLPLSEIEADTWLIHDANIAMDELMGFIRHHYNEVHSEAVRAEQNAPKAAA